MKQYKLIILLALLFLASGQVTMAQFKVMASSGNSQVNGKKAYVGTPVAGTSQIVVPAQSYISLLHPKSRGTVEISKAGTYKAADLEKELLKRTGQSTGQRYANYIIGELTKAGGKDIHKNPYAYSNVTGSVERDPKSGIIVQMPKTSQVYGSEFVIQWDPYPGVDSYKLEILNDFDEVAKVIETKDTSVRVNLSIPELEDADIAKMRITSKDGSVESLYFALTKPEQTALKNIEKGLKGLDLPESPSAVDKLLEAQLFEENDFKADAMKAYQAAIAMDPTFEPFKVAYTQFLIRAGVIDADTLKNDKE